MLAKLKAFKIFSMLCLPRWTGYLWGIACMLVVGIACTSGEPPVVFTSDRDGNKEIYAVYVDGGGELNITQSATNEFEPIVSPDRKWIAFLSGSESTGNVSLEVIARNGVSRQRVTEVPGVHSSHRWSPDSRRIAYALNSRENKSVHIGNIEGAKPILLTALETEEVGGWSPSGKEVVFAVQDSEEQGIWSRNPDGVNEFQLSTDVDSSPRWSPDGERIAFISLRDGNPEIYVMNWDGSGATRLTNNEAKDDMISWSPDSKSLVFVSEQDGNPEIYTAEVYSGEITRLTFNEIRDGQPVWSPSGTRIAFVSHVPDEMKSKQDGDAEIFVMDVDGGNQIRLTNNEFEDINPSW